MPDFLDLDISYFKFHFCLLPGVHVLKAELGLLTKLSMFKIPALAPGGVARLVGMPSLYQRHIPRLRVQPPARGTCRRRLIKVSLSFFLSTLSLPLLLFLKHVFG